MIDKPQTPRRRQRFAADRWRYPLISFASVVGMICLWALVTGLGLVSSRVLPSPGEVLVQAGYLIRNGYADNPLIVHIGWSLFRATSGFLLGVALAIRWACS